MYSFYSRTANNWGTRWLSWSRHCATSQKVVVSIPDGFIGIFHLHSSQAETASNRIEYQEYFLGSYGGRSLGLIILSLSFAEYHEIWEPQPPGTLRACVHELLFCAFFFLLALQPPLGVVFYSPLVSFSLLACEVSWSHTTTRHIQ